MKRILIALLLSLAATPALAVTDVWLFYGAGFHAFSAGMNTIARRAGRYSQVTVHGPYDYMETQRAYNEIAATPSSHTIIVGGYSCGGNAALVVARALTRPVALLAIQPSIWCGRGDTTSNVGYAQDTYSTCLMTAGLGCMQWSGAARKTLLIQRPQRHLSGDDDPVAQDDMVYAIAALSNPARRSLLYNHLGRTTTFVRASGTTIRVEGR